MGEFEKRIDAAKRGRVAKVRAIILGHAELINQRDQTGATALHYAAFGGHRGVVQALVEQGAQMNAADGNSVRPLPGGRSNTCARWVDSWRLNWKTLPTRYGEVTSEWVTRFLERFPALRHASDSQGRSFELLAQESGSPEIAKLFGSADLAQ